MSEESMLGSLVAGRFRISSFLGEGAMAEVYLAEHEALRRQFAIKVLKTKVATEPILVERFRREARAASRLDHPNIVHITDFGQMDDGRLYLAMEYSDGRSLREEIEDLAPRRLPQSRVLEILQQVSDAMDAAHRAKVVHRDLKPANIMLVRDRSQVDRVKILDFGLAKVLGDSDEFELTKVGEIFGTPAYIAPEQARGEKVDHRVDIYALGVMMFELLCGRLPFEHENVTEMLLAQQSEKPPRPSSFLASSEQPIPSALEELVLRCLAKEPADRPQSASEVQRLLDTLRDDARRIGHRPTVRFSDIGGLDRLSVRELASPQSVSRDRGHIGDSELWDEKKIGSLQVSASSSARPDTSLKPSCSHDSDDDRRAWHWQQACKKCKTLATLLLRDGLGGAELTGVLSKISKVEAEILSQETEIALLEDRHQDVDYAFRDREASLRYAVVDLSIERGRILERMAVGARNVYDLDYQIGELEARLNEVYQEKIRKLSEIDDELAACAQHLDELFQQQLAQEVLLVQMLHSLRPVARSAKAKSLYESVDSQLMRAR